MASTTARRRHPALAAGLATMALALGFAAAPAEAAAPTAYVALGDSYAAGQGAAPYQNTCYRSGSSYASLADAAKSVRLATNAACSGAKTQDVVATQLRRLNPSIKLVTITAGGNNLGFGNIVGSCGALAFGDFSKVTECGAASAYAEDQLSSRQLYFDVLSMIRSVDAAAPNARIVVTGYPYLLDPIEDGRTDPLALFTYQATNLADNLNGTIAVAAADAANDGIDVDYVDVRAAFAGHGVMTLDPWINFASPTVADNFHPNAKGYKAYFAALSAAGTYSSS